MRNSDRRKPSRRLLEWTEICACSNEFISPPAASDPGIERHRDAIFRPRELAFGNSRHDLCDYFEGLDLAFSQLLS